MQHIELPARSCKSSTFCVIMYTSKSVSNSARIRCPRLAPLLSIVFVFDCKVQDQSRVLYQPSGVATSSTLWPSHNPSLSRKFYTTFGADSCQLILQVSFHSYNFSPQIHRLFFELGFILKVKIKKKKFEYCTFFYTKFFLKLIKQLNLRICG
jgi:hypothetical protein